MGKKQKVDINGAPLQSITIGEIKKSKYGWIGTILLFSLFIGVVYFLPELSKLYQEYMGKSTIPSGNTPINNGTNNTTNVTVPDESEDPVEETLYEFGVDDSINVGSLLIRDIVLSESGISFRIVNTSETPFDIKANELYLQTYDTNTTEKQIINTVELEGVLSPKKGADYFYEINTNVKYFRIEKIMEEDYTYIIVEPNEEGVAQLTCESANENIIYSFVDDKLIKIKHEATLMKDDENYDEKYASFYGIISNYSDVAGVTSRLRTSEDSVVFTIEIDYNYFSSKITNDYYFDKGISPRIVNFKMESKLFNCK